MYLFVRFMGKVIISLDLNSEGKDTRARVSRILDLIDQLNLKKKKNQEGTNN